ncbi:DNA repair protein RadC [Kordiimonas sp. SCSIO 12610]|uniref:RadC family protein n=1 Tax=Kordiimonas sp. SCSIO 12610 TaxID=2829597 RepID=UPI00210B18B6|nr:DNA repair protein RadC [Kordiimonas sp. SCSIO 12610]UTW56574.1 DNA repair protein RadC [Kordiimonas sp. SCSIO 12610]
MADKSSDHAAEHGPKYTPEYAKGHRARLRDRFLKGGVDGLADYELLEMLLMAAIPRKDVKPLAKDLIKDFGSYAAVLSAPLARLQEYPGLGASAVALLKTVEASVHELTKSAVHNKPVLSSWDALITYLKSTMSHLENEQFRVIYLNTAGEILLDDVLSDGDGHKVSVSPRHIVQKALSVDARSLILAHNHPSGLANPSKADINSTNEIIEACKPLEIIVHDHLILSNSDYISFKALGLL